MKTQRIINNVVIMLVALCIVIFDAAGLIACFVERGTVVYTVLINIMVYTLTCGFPIAFMSCMLYDKNAGDILHL